MSAAAFAALVLSLLAIGFAITTERTARRQMDALDALLTELEAIAASREASARTAASDRQGGAA